MAWRDMNSPRVFLAALFTLTTTGLPRSVANAESQSTSNEQLAIALNVLQSVKQTLKAADHDYGGHRAAAIRDVGTAERQLREALFAVTSPDDKGAPKRPRTRESQIISNSQLLQAVPVLTNTVALLNSAFHDYRGHRAKAVRSVEAAIAELEKALAYVSGRKRTGGGATAAGAAGQPGRRVATTTTERLAALRTTPHHRKLHVARKGASKAKSAVKHHHLAKKAKHAIKTDKHAKRHSAAHATKKAVSKHPSTKKPPKRGK